MVGFLGDLKTPKFHSEINWPLKFLADVRLIDLLWDFLIFFPRIYSKWILLFLIISCPLNGRVIFTSLTVMWFFGKNKICPIIFLFPLNFHSKLMSYLPFTEKDFSKVKIVVVLCQHGIDFSPVKYLILDTKPFTMHVCLKMCHFQIWRIFSLFCKMHARIPCSKCKGPKFSHLMTNLSTGKY